MKTIIALLLTAAIASAQVSISAQQKAEARKSLGLELDVDVPTMTTAQSGGVTLAPGKLLGRHTTGTGAPEQLVPGSGIVIGPGTITLGAITPTSVNGFDLTTLGTAAFTASTAYATASQGALAVSAVQPAALAVYVPTTLTVNGQALSGNITISTITGNAGTATALQTPRAINGVNFDGSAAITITVPVATGITGLGTGVATFLATPTSANLAGALTNETGTGAAVFATSPALTAPTVTSINVNSGTTITRIKHGTAVLVAGTVVVSDATTTANSRIFLTCEIPGGTPGFLRVSARSAGASFTILSSSSSDASTVGWVMFEP